MKGEIPEKRDPGMQPQILCKISTPISGSMNHACTDQTPGRLAQEKEIDGYLNCNPRDYVFSLDPTKLIAC